MRARQQHKAAMQALADKRRRRMANLRDGALKGVIAALRQDPVAAISAADSIQRGIFG